MKMVNVTEAKAQLSAIIEEVSRSGSDVIIARAGRPIVRLVPYRPRQHQPRLGLFAGQIRIPDDFDEWPEDTARALGIVD